MQLFHFFNEIIRIQLIEMVKLQILAARPSGTEICDERLMAFCSTTKAPFADREYVNVADRQKPTKRFKFSRYFDALA